MAFGLAVLFVAGAFLVPDSVLKSVSGLFGVREQEAVAFGHKATALDEALDNDSDISVILADSTIEELAPHVAVRRALRAGPMTADEVVRATRILERALSDLDVARDEAEKAEIWDRASRRLIEVCPRLDGKLLSQELETFYEQLTRARPRPASGGVFADLCASCHSQTAPLPDERTFDAVGIYPFMGDNAAFDGGRNIPLLSESLELAALPRAEGDEVECLSCHVPHGAADFSVGKQDRIDNQGLWVNIIPAEHGVFHVQVKTKNHDSGHRAPAGYPWAAYVISVEAYQGDMRLPLRYGSRLPGHLRAREHEAGMAFARQMIDANGDVTTELDEVVDLQLDSRLSPGRFAEEHFVFDRRGDGPVRAVVTLWYLPDYATWKGAEAVRRADETE